MRIGETIYLDYQASTPSEPSVLKIISDTAQKHFANPHAADHSLGWQAAAVIEESASHVGALFGLEPEELIFTSGASEANSMAIQSARHIATKSNKREIIVGDGDHLSILNEANSSGLTVKPIALDRSGSPDPKHLEELISQETALVSIIGVNNENGAIANLSAFSSICEAHGVILHVDLSQAPLAIDVDVAALNIPLATVSSHKLYGPKGIGALLTGPGTSAILHPIVKGAGQQNGHRGGTLPTELIAGFGEACRLVSENKRLDRCKVAELRDIFVKSLSQKTNACLVGELQNRHPMNALVRFPGFDASDLLSRLQPHIAASTQSACSSGKIEPSHVIQAMGYDRHFASECARFSFGRFSDSQQVDDAVSLISRVLNN